MSGRFLEPRPGVHDEGQGLPRSRRRATQFDAGWFSADANVQDNINNPYEDGVDFRRGRIRIDGTMYYTIDWAVEYDFFNSFDARRHDAHVTGPTDLWWDVQRSALGSATCASATRSRRSASSTW